MVLCIKTRWYFTLKNELNKPNKHHYVPQFYLRQFSCSECEYKVPTASLNGSYIIVNNKSIEGVGYEDKLYSISNQNIEWCIEERLNRTIETPISQSSTWEKIKNNQPERLNEEDKLILYLFMRHVEARNLEMLEFIRSEHKKFSDPRFFHEYTASERDMHSYIALTENGEEHLYLEMTGDIERFLVDFEKVSISIIESNIPIRTSTNPVVTLPEMMTYQGEGNGVVVAKWLPLSPHFGAMFYFCENFNDFNPSSIAGDDVIRSLNRLYIIQILNSKTVRHVITSDEYLVEDLQWAKVFVDPGNPKKYKIKR